MPAAQAIRPTSSSAEQLLNVSRLVARLRRMLSASRPTGEWWWEVSRELAALENAVWQVGREADSPCDAECAHRLTMRIAAVRVDVAAQPRRFGDAIAAVAAVLERVEAALTHGVAAA